MSKQARCRKCGYPLDFRPNEYGMPVVQPCKVCELQEKGKQVGFTCPTHQQLENVRTLLARESAKREKDTSYWIKQAAYWQKQCNKLREELEEKLGAEVARLNADRKERQRLWDIDRRKMKQLQEALEKILATNDGSSDTHLDKWTECRDIAEQALNDNSTGKDNNTGEHNEG